MSQSMSQSVPKSSTALERSYAWCRNLTKKRARNFYYAIRLLPRERGDAMCAVYAFFRECDDISDADNICNRKSGLEKWRRLLNGEQPDRFMPGLIAFRHACKKFQIPNAYFSDLIDGTIMDVDECEYKTFADLYGYCYRVASTVGLVCICIFGCHSVGIYSL